MTATASSLEARLLNLDTCAVSDALDRLGLSGAAIGIMPMWHCPKIAGRVLTVQLKPKTTEPSTRHLCTAAIEAAEAGNVIVVDNEGRTNAAGWGGILSQAAKVKGVAGVIVDGAIRDLDESHEIRFPVYARSAIPCTARGRIVETSFNEPITVGGVWVKPGDLVLADSSGVVFISAERVGEVLDTAEGIAEREREMTKAVQAGKSVVEVMGANYERMTGAH